MRRPHLSSSSPIATSAVVAMILCDVRWWEWTSMVWPPETSKVRKGKDGVNGGLVDAGLALLACVVLDMASTIREVRA